jgi:Asp-tRNA(Asn)/Glu-tRNA(Gln) amidotransferase A subunit family amidase
MGSELWRLDATELSGLIRAGTVSSREAVTDVLARMDEVNPAVNAVVRRMDEEALAAADQADAALARGEALGVLHGVPVTTKINIDQKGHPTDNGVVAFKDLMAPQDAPTVSHLRKAGAILVGRTNAPASRTMTCTAAPSMAAILRVRPVDRQAGPQRPSPLGWGRSALAMILAARCAFRPIAMALWG